MAVGVFMSVYAKSWMIMPTFGALWLVTLILICTGAIHSKSGDQAEKKIKTSASEAIVMSIILVLVPIEVDSITEIAKSNPREPTTIFFIVRLLENVGLTVALVVMDHESTRARILEILVASILLITIILQIKVARTKRQDMGSRILVAKLKSQRWMKRAKKASAERQAKTGKGRMQKLFSRKIVPTHSGWTGVQDVKSLVEAEAEDTEEAAREIIDRSGIVRNFKGTEEPHSAKPELWNIDGTELDLVSPSQLIAYRYEILGSGILL
eukprot:SAG31_NODE_327_length_17650_cov_18.626574_10_plen_268_part_00